MFQKNWKTMLKNYNGYADRYVPEKMKNNVKQGKSEGFESMKVLTNMAHLQYHPR